MEPQARERLKGFADRLNTSKKHLSKNVLFLLLGVVSTVLLLPIACLRYMSGDYIIALINAVITVIIIFTCVFIIAGKKIQRVNEVKIVAAVFLTIGIAMAAYQKETVHIYGLFPAIIVFYYLLSERVATVFCASSIAITLAIIYPKVNAVDLFGIFVTLLLSAAFSYLLFSNYRKAVEKLAIMAETDPLTTTGNRRALDQKLSIIRIQQQRQAAAASLLLLDLDYFKKINDEYGHLVGDRVLIELVTMLTEHLQAKDTLFRYGGEEFVIAPLNMTLAAATEVAENLRIAVKRYQFTNNVSLTVSIGVAEYRQSESVEKWIQRADAALYTAKISGRNVVVSESEIKQVEQHWWKSEVAVTSATKI